MIITRRSTFARLIDNEKPDRGRIPSGTSSKPPLEAMIAFSRKEDHKRCAVTGRQWGNKPQANVDRALDKVVKTRISTLLHREHWWILGM
jgi:hypothetical protein